MATPGRHYHQQEATTWIPQIKALRISGPTIWICKIFQNQDLELENPGHAQPIWGLEVMSSVNHARFTSKHREKAGASAEANAHTAMFIPEHLWMHHSRLMNPNPLPSYPNDARDGCRITGRQYRQGDHVRSRNASSAAYQTPAAQ